MNCRFPATVKARSKTSYHRRERTSALSRKSWREVCRREAALSGPSAAIHSVIPPLLPTSCPVAARARQQAATAADDCVSRRPNHHACGDSGKPRSPPVADAVAAHGFRGSRHLPRWTWQGPPAVVPWRIGSTALRGHRQDAVRGARDRRKPFARSKLPNTGKRCRRPNDRRRSPELQGNSCTRKCSARNQDGSRNPLLYLN